MRRIALFAALLSGLSCRDPRVDANVAQAMIEVGNNLAQINMELGELHNSVDSLHAVVAKQDSIIVRLANLAGMPIPGR